MPKPDMYLARRLAATLPMLAGVERIEHLAKGHSQDVKYVLWAGGQPTYLLRTSDLSERERRRAEFEQIQWHHGRGRACSSPLAWGVAEDAGVCYSLLGYIVGDCAQDVLPTLPEAKQYEIGLQAGTELRRLHEAPCPDAAFDWHNHKLAKHLRYADQCHQQGLSLDGGLLEAAEDFVRDHHEWMRGIHSTFQHDDYHPGNLIVRDGRLAGIIDFNRWDWGDPWHDFVKVSFFSRFISQAFSRGQIDGYFGAPPPERFWRLLTLYVAMIVTASLAWGYRWEPAEYDWWRQRSQETLLSHDLASAGPPEWYPGYAPSGK